MKLEAKLNLSTAAMVCVMLLDAGTTHLRVLRIVDQAKTVDGQRQPFVLKLEEMRTDLAQTATWSRLTMENAVQPEDHAMYRAEAVEATGRVRADLSALETMDRELVQGPGQGKLADLSAQLQGLAQLEEQAPDLRTAADEQSGMTRKIVGAQSGLMSAVEEMEAAQKALVAQELLELQDEDRIVVRWLWVGALAGGLLGGAISAVLGSRIARAVTQVASRANAIAAGDLTGRALQLDSDDEIGGLAEAMNGMQMALGGIIGTVADTAGSLTGSAASMRSASDLIHRRIDQQSQQTQQAATAMQEMSASIAEVSRHTQSAAETARSAAQTARDGGLIVKQMLGSMHSIASAVTETSSTVGLLGDDSKRISQIVTVIDEIARKTNLLALNAAIEAARAGDQGRGFAVVAGEVRRLAESTAQATGEIGTMIQEIQDRTRTAIASMASGTGTVQQGVVTTTQAGEALERIIGMAERVDRMITQIAIAASQQAAAADQSSASLDSIHSLSHENLSEMATTAAGIETLRGTAVTLERQVDRFQVQSHTHSTRRAA